MLIYGKTRLLPESSSRNSGLLLLSLKSRLAYLYGTYNPCVYVCKRDYRYKALKIQNCTFVRNPSVIRRAFGDRLHYVDSVERKCDISTGGGRVTPSKLQGSAHGLASNFKRSHC